MRFGNFELDPEAYELKNAGLPVKLERIPMELLLLLAAKEGRLLTREEIVAHIWGKDHFLDSESAINTAIRKLRKALGEGPEHPRFIETVPRRGYRFIAPVSELQSGDGSSGRPAATADSKDVGVAGIPEAAPAVEETNGHDATTPGTLSPRRRARIWTLSIAGAVILVAVLAAVAHRIYFRAPPQTPPVKRAMLAVLPFQNLSNDPSQEYFSDGLTEETITDLGQLSPAKLGVVARTSAMAYKHTDKTVSQIGRELGVDYILEGSVRREKGLARVSAQLIRVSDQTHVWAQSYDDRNLNNLLDVENAIGTAIAEQVQIQITPQSQLELSKMRAVNPEAYDLYLQGRFYWNQRTPPSIRESVHLFQRAIAADPGFALAYAGLADAYNIGNIIGLYSPEESLPQARAAATRAIELDPTVAEAHAALGMEKSHYEFDFPGAQAEFLKAIDLNPSSAYAHFFYSNCYLMPMGRRAEAVAENKKALELDPLSLPINNFMAETYLLAGDYSRSYQQFQHTIAMAPNFPLSHIYFAGLLEQMGRYEDAIDENEKAQVLSGSTPEEAARRAKMMLDALKSGGEKGYWKEHLAQDLREAEKSGALAASNYVAFVYALAGDKDKAFEFLEKAYKAREGSELTLLAVDPVWKNLHGDPRFSDLLRRIGLPELPANGESGY